jgi:chaperonin GroEL (HSP60 family)
VILEKEPINAEMPKRLANLKVLVVDDALEPEELEDEALATEAGFSRYLQNQEEFKQNVRRIVELGVNTLVLVDRGVLDAAEDILTDASVMVLSRISAKNCGWRQSIPEPNP